MKIPISIAIAKLTEGDGYRIVAKDLLQGVEALATLPLPFSPRSCALLAGHALECTLKAFLWHKGKKKEIRASKVRHDLTALWDMAYKEGLSIPRTTPRWVTVLSIGHGPNFYFRYQEGQGQNIVHVGSTPALAPMAAELKKLIDIVELAVKS
jgi:hypothetical protein